MSYYLMKFLGLFTGFLPSIWGLHNKIYGGTFRGIYINEPSASETELFLSLREQLKPLPIEQYKIDCAMWAYAGVPQMYWAYKNKTYWLLDARSCSIDLEFPKGTPAIFFLELKHKKTRWMYWSKEDHPELTDQLEKIINKYWDWSISLHTNKPIPDPELNFIGKCIIGRNVTWTEDLV